MAKYRLIKPQRIFRKNKEELFVESTGAIGPSFVDLETQGGIDALTLIDDIISTAKKVSLLQLPESREDSTIDAFCDKYGASDKEKKKALINLLTALNIGRSKIHLILEDRTQGVSHILYLEDI